MALVVRSGACGRRRPPAEQGGCRGLQTCSCTTWPPSRARSVVGGKKPARYTRTPPQTSRGGGASGTAAMDVSRIVEVLQAVNSPDTAPDQRRAAGERCRVPTAGVTGAQDCSEGVRQRPGLPLSSWHSPFQPCPKMRVRALLGSWPGARGSDASGRVAVYTNVCFARDRRSQSRGWWSCATARRRGARRLNGSPCGEESRQQQRWRL